MAAPHGRYRRLSLAFLREERGKLERWREKVRARHADAVSALQQQKGSVGGRHLPPPPPQPASQPLIPPGMPRPLLVGTRVLARHPKDRQLADGSVLTVEVRCSGSRNE